MDNYSIYNYTFDAVPVEGDFFRTEDSDPPAVDDDRRKKKLEMLFGEKNTVFRMVKYNKNDADELPCTVLAHPEHFVLLRLENPKQVKLFEKHESHHGEVPRIDESHRPSYPYLYIVIDCREKCGCKIAISTNSSAWRKTDKVAELLQDNVNEHLKNLQQSFAIKLTPEVMTVDFVSHSRYLVKKKNLSVSKMTIYFTRGITNPIVEEIIKNDNFVKGLLKRTFNALHSEITLYGPETERIIRKNSLILSHLVSLAASDPVSEPFRLSMTYSDNSKYSCGKDVRMEFLMGEYTFLGMLGVTNLFPEQTIGHWFDTITNEIDERKKTDYSKY